MKSSAIRTRHTKSVLLTATFLLALLSTTLLPIFTNLPTALAGSDTYPAPWAPPTTQDSLVDTWGELNRECTSYASWMLHSVNGFEMPFHDDAVNWGPDASSRGYTVDMHPAVGSIFWSSSIDHVGWVESVSADGSAISYEDYNFGLNGLWSEHTGVATSSASGYIHFKDVGANAPSVSTAYNPSNGLGAFAALGPGNRLYYYWQNSDGTWNGPLQIGGASTRVWVQWSAICRCPRTREPALRVLAVQRCPMAWAAADWWGEYDLFDAVNGFQW